MTNADDIKKLEDNHRQDLNKIYGKLDDMANSVSDLAKSVAKLVVHNQYTQKTIEELKSSGLAATVKKAVYWGTMIGIPLGIITTAILTVWSKMPG